MSLLILFDWLFKDALLNAKVLTKLDLNINNHFLKIKKIVSVFNKS